MVLLLVCMGCNMRDEQCAQAAGCEIDGLCAHDGATCVATRPEHCARSSACRIHGRCTLAHGSCRVESDADCAESEVCKENRSCQRVIRWDGIAACVPPCRKRKPCAAAGFCERIGDRCRPGSDDDCRQAVACKTMGRCTRNDDGFCALLSDADCKLTNGCKRNGACTYRHGRCVED